MFCILAELFLTMAGSRARTAAKFVRILDKVDNPHTDSFTGVDGRNSAAGMDRNGFSAATTRMQLQNGFSGSAKDEATTTQTWNILHRARRINRGLGLQTFVMSPLPARRPAGLWIADTHGEGGTD
jgi:hypothetical protein